MKNKTLFKEFAAYVVPNICGMAGLSCYILADTFFVSKGLGANGLAALSLAIPVYSFVHGCGLMLGMGGATKYSIYRGQNETQQADNVFSNTLYLLSALALLFVLLGIFFSERLTALLGADSVIFTMTKTYLQIILLFAPAFMTNDVVLCFVRNDGNPRLAMTAMLAGSFSNIILDYIFIFPFDMGILGAVLATGLAPLISLVLLSKHWLTRQNQFHVIRTKPSLRLTKTLLSLGAPALITEAASGIVMLVFNAIILHLSGNVGVAAYGIIANLSLVITSIYTGIAQGTQPILSRLYGQGDKNNRTLLFTYAIKTMLFCSCIIYLTLVLAADPIAGIFNSEQHILLQQIAVIGLKLYFTAIPFAGFNIVLSAYFTSTEQILPAQILSLARGAVLIIPMTFTLSYFFQMTGVWLSYPLTEFLITSAGITFYKKYHQ